MASMDPPPESSPMSQNATTRIAEVQPSKRIWSAVIGVTVAVWIVGVYAFLNVAGGPHGAAYTAGALTAVGVVAVHLTMPKGTSRIAVITVVCLVLALLGVRIAEVAPLTTRALDESL